MEVWLSSKLCYSGHMMRKVRGLFKKRRNHLSGRHYAASSNEGRNASGEQVKEAARYVSERFGRAITRLSER